MSAERSPASALAAAVALAGVRRAARALLAELPDPPALAAATSPAPTLAQLVAAAHADALPRVSPDPVVLMRGPLPARPSLPS